MKFRRNGLGEHMPELSLFLALTFLQNGAINMYTNTATYYRGVGLLRVTYVCSLSRHKLENLQRRSQPCEEWVLRRNFASQQNTKTKPNQTKAVTFIMNY